MTEAKLDRKTRDRMRREDDFLLAAERLIGERGFHGTTMEAVARDADCATGTIYRYFRSKEDLYQKLLARKGRAFFRDVMAAEQGITAPLERFRCRIRVELDFHEHNRAFMQVYHNELHACEEEAMSRMPEDVRVAYMKYLEEWQEMLEQGMCEGVFQKMDLSLATAALRGVFRETMQRWMQDDFEGGRGAIESFFYQFLTTGLVREAGDG